MVLYINFEEKEHNIPENSVAGRIIKFISRFFGANPATDNIIDSSRRPIYNPEPLNSHNHNKYYFASKILDAILNNTAPDNIDVRSVHTEVFSGNIITEIENFLNRMNKDKPRGKNKYQIVLRKPAEHNNYLLDAWKNMLISEKYSEINRLLAKNALPKISSLDKIYGTYSHNIIKIFSSAIENKLERYQGLSASTHYNQVGSMVFFSSNLNPDTRLAAAGASHDILEDIVDRENNNIILTYNNVLKEFVHKALVEEVRYMTNHYNMLIHGMRKAFASENGSFRKKSHNYLNGFKDDENFKKYVEKLQEKISQLKHVDHRPIKETLDYLSRITYGLYVEDMLAYPNVLYIKERDLFINSQTLSSMNLQSRIKNIRKQMMLSEAVLKHFPQKKQNTAIEEQLDEYATDNNIRLSIINSAKELQSNSIYLARDILISHIMNPDYTEGIRLLFNMIRPNGQLYNVLYSRNMAA